MLIIISINNLSSYFSVLNCFLGKIRVVNYNIYIVPRKKQAEYMGIYGDIILVFCQLFLLFQHHVRAQKIILFCDPF